jgi:hypothetical protein
LWGGRRLEALVLAIEVRLARRRPLEVVVHDAQKRLKASWSFAWPVLGCDEDTAPGGPCRSVYTVTRWPRPQPGRVTQAVRRDRAPLWC